jgi:hypothetical protein
MSTNYSQTQLANAIPTIVAQRALNKLEADINLVPFVNKDFSNDVAEYGKTVQVARYGDLIANDKEAQTNVTQQNPATAKVDIVLNQHKEVSFLVEDIAGALARPDVIEERLQDAMLTIVESAESYLFGVGATLTGTTGVAKAFTTGNILGDLQMARKTLTEGRAPVTNRGVFLSTEVYSTLLGTNNLSLAQNYGNNVAIADGRVPRVYGFEAYESLFTSETADVVSCLAIHRDALSMVSRALPTQGNGDVISQAIVTRPGLMPMRVTVSYDPRALGTLVTVDALFGAEILRNELGVKLLSDESES